MAKYLDLADYLLIAETVLGVPAETIARWPGIGLAESALRSNVWLPERSRSVSSPAGSGGRAWKRDSTRLAR